MSTAWALALAVAPTALAFMLLGVNDAKRRRTAGELMPSRSAQRIGALLIFISGLFVLVAAGAVAFLIWISALGAIGWALANGVVTVAAWSRGSGQAGLTWAVGRGIGQRNEALGPARLIGRSREALRALRGSSIGLPAVAATTSVVLCLVTVIVAFWTVEKTSQGTRELLALQALAAVTQDRSTAPASSCLSAFDGRVDATQALRDLLSGRAFSLSVARGTVVDDVSTNLQRCIAASGSDEIAVEASPDRKSEIYTVDGRNAGAILRLITDRLRHAELLAAVYGADASLCRIVWSQIDDDVAAFAALLQRERAYPKAQAMLDRLPALDRLIAVHPIGSTCP